MNKYLITVILCLTLGLAPFQPEPHLFGKIRWVLGGAKGMALIDWFDLVLHAAPFVVLFYFIISDILKKLKRN
jgi:hypothetical protein